MESVSGIARKRMQPTYTIEHRSLDVRPGNNVPCLFVAGILSALMFGGLRRRWFCGNVSTICFYKQQRQFYEYCSRICKHGDRDNQSAVNVGEVDRTLNAPISNGIHLLSIVPTIGEGLGWKNR